MGHNLNYHNGRYSFFSVKEKPWHQLGTIVDSPLTAEEAIKLANLDYTVVKKPINFHSETGIVPIPDKYATVRTDTNQALGIVGKKYQVVQNVDAFSFFDSIVGEGQAIYETAGVLGKGEKIFLTAKLPNYIEVAEEDLLEQYLFLYNSHDGVGSICAGFTPVRIVCNNTLNAALGGIKYSTKANKALKNAIRITHTLSAQEKLKQAHKLLGIVSYAAKEMEEVFKILAAKHVTSEAFKDLVKQSLITQEISDRLAKDGEFSKRFNSVLQDVLEYSEVAPSQQMKSTKGTLWGVYNAVSGYFQNVKQYKSPNLKFKNLLLDGTDKAKVQKCLNLCLDYAKNN